MRLPASVNRRVRPRIALAAPPGGQAETVLPLRDAAGRPGPTPVIMLALVGLNVAVFILEMALPRSHLEQFIIGYGLIPSVITTAPLGRLPSGLPAVASMVTSLFLHSGVVHLAGNMVFLWVFGDNLEDALGHLTFLLVYLASGAGAALSHVVAFHASSMPSIGASGAVAGILAGYLLLFPRATVRTLLIAGPFVTLGRVRAVVLIGSWAAVQFLQGMVSVNPLGSETGGVGYVAHVGGFLTGAGLVALIRTVREQPLGRLRGAWRWGWLFRNWAAAAGVVGLLVLVTSAVSAVGSPRAAHVVYAVGMSLTAVIALSDGLRRLTGHGSPLAAGGRSRATLAAVQMALALGLLATTLLSLAVL